ncbi:hypothetical protein FKW77_008792 [Venturia effusa]|uniref:Chromo domain-containing protein n=1 Tax=Venturia effusa TaxID=50376 RepID=A0A517KZY6_9PEZI|nr:hypothetical protein FKW77_008792 [Venturia effusa]
MMYLTRAKRRRTSNSETGSRARKRGKRHEASDEHDAAAAAAESEEEGKLWSRKILEEKTEKGRTRYLVGWEEHERKSDTWKNEWKAASALPSGLKKEWEAKKNRPEQPESSDIDLSPPPESEEEPSDYEANFERPAQRRVRRPRVLESSSQPPETPRSPLPARPIRSLEKSLIIDATPGTPHDAAAASSPLPHRVQSLLHASPERINPSPEIIVTQDSDFHRSEYEIGLSQPSQAQTADQPELLAQQTPVRYQNTQTKNVGTQLPTTIPDSQSESDLRISQEKISLLENREIPQSTTATNTARPPEFSYSTQTPAARDELAAIEETPQSASPALLVLETDPVEPASPAIGKHSTRRTKKLTAALVGSDSGDGWTKSSAPATLDESPKRTASRRSSVSRKPRANVTPVAVSSQQQSLPSTRSRLSEVEAVDFQQAQSRDCATEHWVSALDQTTDSSPSGLSFSQRLKDQLQSTAPENESSALQQSPAALSAPIEQEKAISRDPPKPASKVSERSETSFDMPKTRRSLRTGRDAHYTQEPISSVAAPTPSTSKTIRGGRGGVSTRKTKRFTEETPQKGFDKPAENKRRGRPPARSRQTITRGGSMESQTDSEAQTSAVPAEEPIEPSAVETDSDGRTHLPARIPVDDGDMALETREADEMEIDSQSGESTESDDQEDSGPSLEQMEFMVPLPMAGQPRDQYRRTVKFHDELIERFTSRKWREYDGIMKQAEDFVQTMHDIVTHIDLTNDTTASQSDVEPADVVEWDRSVSPKFKFLWHLFDALRNHKVHIVIMVKPGRLLDILENFLKGTNLRYSRPDVDRRDDGPSDPLTVSLLSASGESLSAPVRPANLVLSLDHVVDVKNPLVRALRTNSTRPEYLAPVVSLAIVNSVDHIERSCTPNLVGVNRVRVLVTCIAKLRREAGKTEGNFAPIDESAMEVARFVLMGGTEDQWPLPSIGTLDNNDAWDLTQGLTTMRSSNSSDSEKSAKAKAALNSQKRRMQDEDLQPDKKMRMTPQAEQDASITRISDSVPENSSLLDKTPSDSQEMMALRNLLKAAEEKLQETIKARDIQEGELENALGDLQFRFEEQSKQKRELVGELNQVRNELELIKTQKENRDITVDKLREERRELQIQLDEARAALAGSAIPEVAAAEKLRQDVGQAQEDKRKAEKMLDSQSSLNGYLSQQYSQASDRATELAGENRELESRIKILEKQASGEIAKARQQFQDEQKRRTAMENAKLKAQVSNLTALLSRKEEELRTKKAGVGTRASSVPRSPRVGPASRANSPIPDRRIGALKNNMPFQGRRPTSRPTRLEDPQTPQRSPTNEHPPSQATQTNNATPVIQEPKPKPGKPVEIKTIEARVPDLRQEPPSRPDPRHEHRQAETKMPPEPIPPAPRPEIRQSSTNNRPFPCCFAQYNCGSAFTSKNEWKRHISTKHIQLGFWRCDMCPPSPGIDHPIFNDFNRKDLFTQHLRRMHAVNTPQGTQEQPKAIAPSAPPGGGPPVAPPNTNPPGLTDEQIMDIQKRCYRQLRGPPEVSSCVFCTRTFSGPNSWEERLEHVGGHLERDRKNGTACTDVTNWRADPSLRDYLLVEGLVEIDQRGGYRIGDGKPRRPLDIEGFAGQQPTTQLTPRPNHTTDAIAGATTDQDSEGSNEKRRRGRAGKKPSDAGSRVEMMELDPPTPQSQPPSQSQPTPQPQEQPRNLPLPSPSQNGPMRSPSAHQPYGPGAPMQSPGLQHHSPYQQSQDQVQRRSPGPAGLAGPEPREAIPPRPNTTPSNHQPQQHMHSGQMIMHHQQQGTQQQVAQQQGPQQHVPQQQGPQQQGRPQHLQQNLPPGQPHYGQPPQIQQPQQQQGPPLQQNHPHQQQPQQHQIQRPPSNIMPMYQFHQGTFTKFSGTSLDQLARGYAGLRANELPPPAQSTRANTGQPQLAPRPPPDPRDAILNRIWDNAPSLRPTGHSQDQQQLPSMPPRAPLLHSGFKAINEQQATPSRPQDSMQQLAPKPPSDGARQLAPKPLMHPSPSPVQQEQKSMQPMQQQLQQQNQPVPGQGLGPRSITPQPPAMSGAEREGEKSQANQPR